MKFVLGVSCQAGLLRYSGGVGAASEGLDGYTVNSSHESVVPVITMSRYKPLSPSELVGNVAPADQGPMVILN